ncbi:MULTISPECIES: hypothetical protein [unclassified Streptomyces]|uniref:hypothetical protein n=1 Tax=unclassified Streptomyces TaxID=2593676 RepID=UPI0004BD702B|nr:MULTISPECIES: hypothetical protein [unclassified Streptomyces]
MRIAVIIGAATISALASFIYIRYLTYGFVLGLSLAVLNNVLPLWASLAVFLAAVLSSTELARRLDNRRAENRTTSADGSGVP